MFHYLKTPYWKRKVYGFLFVGSIFVSLVLILQFNHIRSVAPLQLQQGGNNVNFEPSAIGCPSEVNESQVYLWDQKNPCLADYVRKHFLLPPANQGRKLTSSNGDNYKNWISELVAQLFPHKVDGTFIEVGAHDGEEASNTLWFEFQGWTGLLIECNPVTLPKLLTKHRKAWIAKACLSTIQTPQHVNFMTLKERPESAQLWKPLNDHLMKYWKFDKLEDTTWYNYSLPAFPLYSLLKGTGAFTQIDFLSLDVQGIEFQVLRNFPFEEFDIKVIIAEVDPLLISKEDLSELLLLMSRNGYTVIKKFDYDIAFARHL